MWRRFTKPRPLRWSVSPAPPQGWIAAVDSPRVLFGDAGVFSLPFCYLKVSQALLDADSCGCTAEPPARRWPLVSALVCDGPRPYPVRWVMNVSRADSSRRVVGPRSSAMMSEGCASASCSPRRGFPSGENADAELLRAAVHADGARGGAAVLHGDGLDVA